MKNLFLLFALLWAGAYANGKAAEAKTPDAKPPPPPPTTQPPTQPTKQTAPPPPTPAKKDVPPATQPNKPPPAPKTNPTVPPTTKPTPPPTKASTVPPAATKAATVKQEKTEAPKASTEKPTLPTTASSPQQKDANPALASTPEATTSTPLAPPSSSQQRSGGSAQQPKGNSTHPIPIDVPANDLGQPDLHRSILSHFLFAFVNLTRENPFDPSEAMDMAEDVTDFRADSAELLAMTELRRFIQKFKYLKADKYGRNLDIPFDPIEYAKYALRTFYSQKLMCINDDLLTILDKAKLEKEHDGHETHIRKLHEVYGKELQDILDSVECFGSKIIERIPNVIMDRKLPKEGKIYYVRELIGDLLHHDYTTLEKYVELYEHVIQQEPKYGQMATELFNKNYFIPLIQKLTVDNTTEIQKGSPLEVHLREEIQQLDADLEKKYVLGEKLSSLMQELHKAETWVDFTNSTAVLEIIKNRLWKTVQSQFPKSPELPELTTEILDELYSKSAVYSEILRLFEAGTYTPKVVDSLKLQLIWSVRRSVLDFIPESQIWHESMHLLEESNIHLNKTTLIEHEVLTTHLEEVYEKQAALYRNTRVKENVYAVIENKTLNFLEKVAQFENATKLSRTSQIFIPFREVVYFNLFEPHFRSTYSKEAVDYLKNQLEGFLRKELYHNGDEIDVEVIDEQTQAEVTHMRERLQYEIGVDQRLEHWSIDDLPPAWMDEYYEKNPRNVYRHPVEDVRRDYYSSGYY